MAPDADPIWFRIIALARKGYCGGDPARIISLPVRMVLDMLDYEEFVNDYEELSAELNA